MRWPARCHPAVAPVPWQQPSGPAAPHTGSRLSSPGEAASGRPAVLLHNTQGRRAYGHRVGRSVCLRFRNLHAARRQQRGNVHSFNESSIGRALALVLQPPATDTEAPASPGYYHLPTYTAKPVAGTPGSTWTQIPRHPPPTRGSQLGDCPDSSVQNEKVTSNEALAGLAGSLGVSHHGPRPASEASLSCHTQEIRVASLSSGAGGACEAHHD